VLFIGFACILPVVFCCNLDVLNDPMIQPVCDSCDPVCMRNGIYEILTSKPLIMQNKRSTTIKIGGGSGTNLELSNGQIQGLTLGKRVLSLRDSTDHCEIKEDAMLYNLQDRFSNSEDTENLNFYSFLLFSNSIVPENNF
jgi:hypothetical protein